MTVILLCTSLLVSNSGKFKLEVKCLSQLASLSRMCEDRFIEEFSWFPKASESRVPHEPEQKLRLLLSFELFSLGERFTEESLNGVEILLLFLLLFKIIS